MKLNKKFFRKAIDEGFKIFFSSEGKIVGIISDSWLEEGTITVTLVLGKFVTTSKIKDNTKCSKFSFDNKEIIVEG